MLKITAAQYKALCNYCAQNFIARAVKRLARTATDPQNRAKPADLRTFVATGLQRARKERVTIEEDVISLLELELQHGEWFWRSRSNLARIVQHESVSSRRRLLQQLIMREPSSAPAKGPGRAP